MTGGYIIIPIRGRNNEKVSLSTTSVNIKQGTYAKITRAIELKKPIVLEDVRTEVDGVYYYTTAGGYELTSSANNLYCFAKTYASSATATKLEYIFIKNDDTAYLSVSVNPA